MSHAPPIWGTAQETLASARRLLGQDLASAERFARAVIRDDPRCGEAHRILGMALRRAGRVSEAKQAEDSAIGLALLEPALREAATALTDYKLSTAERLLRAHLRNQPDDASALRMLAEVAARTGHFDASEQLIGQALEVAPDFGAVNALLAAVRRVRRRELARSGGENPATDDASESLDGEDAFRDGLSLYKQAVEELPHYYENWISYGYVLRTVGRQDEALDKFRRAIEISPSSGEAWWAIADMKSARFAQQDVGRLQSLVAVPDLQPSDRAQLYFALGRALEQFQDTAGAFAAFRDGNAVRSKTSAHDPDAVKRHVDKSIELFNTSFFDQRRGAGDPARDPIFIVGMPRSGSTLLEQILASHPSIEGVSELSDIAGIANGLADFRDAGFQDSPYLDRIAQLSRPEPGQLGLSYIWNSGLHRRSMKPYFVDKMPNNWLHLGLILTILPNAKIIDLRRSPLDCCVSNFRQYFAKGQEFSYSLEHLGRYYLDYTRMLEHFDVMLPGRILQVSHEDLIDQPEAEIRRIFEYLEISFDEHCLRFYENRRAVGTASAEQVRRPINRDGVNQWLPYDQWLAPLKQALGPLLSQ